MSPLFPRFIVPFFLEWHELAKSHVCICWFELYSCHWHLKEIYKFSSWQFLVSIPRCLFAAFPRALTEGAAGQLSICHQTLPYFLPCSFPRAMLSPLNIRWQPFTSVRIHARGETPYTTRGQKYCLLQLLTSGKWSLAGGQQKWSVHTGN